MGFFSGDENDLLRINPVIAYHGLFPKPPKFSRALGTEAGHVPVETRPTARVFRLAELPGRGGDGAYPATHSLTQKRIVSGYYQFYL